MSTSPVAVFVVEDQAPLLQALLRALSHFEELTVVGSARDGETAVEQIVQYKPDIVLVDLELPGINGIEVTRRVKTKQPQIELLILTSFDDEQKVYEAMQAGASGYLVKRVGPEKIRQSIADVMRGGFVVESLIAKRFWNYFHSVQTKAADSQNEFSLEPQEIEVLQYIAKGLSNAEVGRLMSIERRRVKTQLEHIYRKLKVNSHVDAVVVALKAGLIDV
jgi:DNA-binding NarL/FixJ family response regulator